MNTPTNETPQVLKAGAVSAIAAWQPNSGQALKAVAGSKPVYTSADAPGLIYDVLYVSPESLEQNREEWAKIVKVWYRIVDFLKDEANFDEALKILAARVSVKPEEYESFYRGTYILSLEEALQRWKKADGLDSIYGSSKILDDFNVKNDVYQENQDVNKYLDPSLTEAYAQCGKIAFPRISISRLSAAWEDENRSLYNAIADRIENQLISGARDSTGISAPRCRYTVQGASAQPFTVSRWVNRWRSLGKC